jgi:mRNA guanylyltransferase
MKIPFPLPRLKASGEQVDDRIVEVHWDPVGEYWRMMRFRDDKPQGNHRSTVESIVQSIVDGVEKDAVSGLLVILVSVMTRSL